MARPEISELEFDQLRESLKQFLKSNPTFADYNFEGSALSVLIDVLAHAAHYDAYYLNMLFAEAFIDSAQRRGSVVSRAKELNYVPRSATGATATIRVQVLPNDSPAFITVAEGTRFRGKLDGESYVFSTTEAHTILPDGSNNYIGTFDVSEGDHVTETVTITETSGPILVTLSNRNIDTDSLIVDVKPNALSTDKNTWTRIADILEVDSTTEGYFLQENLNGFYELEFGDNVLGMTPETGNVLEIRYRVVNGSEANDLTAITEIDDIGGYQNFTISTEQAADGGQSQEDIESIRFNAPRNYERQNRAVTANDYKQHILNEFSDIQALSVWGGEENDTPLYGKVMLSVKPFNGFTIAETRKDDIKNAIEKINVHSIDPRFVDATFLYVKPTVNVTYDPDLTTLDASQIRSQVATAISTFESNNLGTFSQKFYYSRFLNAIDGADNSIQSNNTSIRVAKRFSPTLNSRLTYVFPFHMAIHHPYDGFLGAVSSSGFKIPTSSRTHFLDDDGRGNIRSYFLDGRTKVFVNRTAGTIDYESGRIVLNNFLPSNIVGDEMEINIVPSTNDLSPVRNEIILITRTIINIIDDNTGTVVNSGTATTTGSTTTVEETPILTTVTI